MSRCNLLSFSLLVSKCTDGKLRPFNVVIHLHKKLTASLSAGANCVHNKMCISDPLLPAYVDAGGRRRQEIRTDTQAHSFYLTTGLLMAQRNGHRVRSRQQQNIYVGWKTGKFVKNIKIWMITVIIVFPVWPIGLTHVLCLYFNFFNHMMYCRSLTTTWSWQWVFSSDMTW